MNMRVWPHLSVVWNRETHSAESSQLAEPLQLSLQLDQTENLIACIGQGHLSGSVLSELLRTLRPHYLLDLRTCPRFDMIGYSRKKAFADFERWGAKYFQLTSTENTGELADRFQALISKVTSDTTQLRGPLVVVIETEDVVDQIVRAMPKRTGKEGAWCVSVEGLPKDAIASHHLHVV